jgi:hypothetical protein
MMRRLAGLMAIVLLAAGISFAAARWFVEQKPATIRELKRELHLSEGQAREIQRLETGFRATLNAACATHCSARLQLGAELGKPIPDVEKCRAAVEQMNAIQAGCEHATLEHILKIRSLLDESQAQRYSVLVSRQLCSMPMGTP